LTVHGAAYGSTPATVDSDVAVVDSSRAPIGSLNTFGAWEVPAGAAPVGAKLLKTGQTVASPFTVVSPAWDSSFVCATQTLTGGTISSITINGGASIATFVGAIIPASATIVVTFASSLTQIVLTF
jgi:hypothetical protein